MKPTVDWLLTNATVLTMNPAGDIHSPGSIAVRDDEIVGVGSSDTIDSSVTASNTIDCHGQVVMPGMINGHTHAPMTLLRGLADDLRLDVWLLGYIMPVEREFVNPEFVRLGTKLACAEMINSGVTCFADMYYFEEYVAVAAADVGMRALCGETILKFPTPDASSYEEAIDRCVSFIEHWNGHPLVTPVIAPHAAYTSTPEILKQCSSLAQEYDVPLHTHIAETEIEVTDSIREHGMTTTAWMKKFGILDTNLIAAHCVHLSDEDILMLKQAGAGIIHNPTSNMKLASGVAPISRMHELGAVVGIGTDGPASNNDLDMLEEIRLATMLSKVSTNDPTSLPAGKVLRMATIEGACALGMQDEIGSLEQGKKADLIIIDLSQVHNSPSYRRDPDSVYAQIVYASKSSDIRDAMVNGKWLMRDRELLTIDQDYLLNNAHDYAERIDSFLIEREQSPLSKLVAIGGVKQEESFEVQVKGRIGKDALVKLESVFTENEITVVRRSLYRQYDTYMFFDSDDPDADRLRFREDQILSPEGGLLDARNRITLLGTSVEREYPGAVMLSRSRYIAPADRSLRFYQEYFQPKSCRNVEKTRHRWRIRYRDTSFAVNFDQLTQPIEDCCFIEIKSRTWSRQDAERKAALIVDLMETLEVDPIDAIPDGYVDLDEKSLGDMLS